VVQRSELGGEYFRFDELRQELRGERTGIRYAIGTKVRVQVSRVDLDARKIDFRLVDEDGALLARALRDKGMTPSPAKAAKKAARKQRQGDEAGAAAALQARQGGKAAKIARHAQGARKPGDKSAKKGRSRR